MDGSGVLADPNGINREELIRLAKGRKMINHFDRSKLSKDGYVVLVDDHDLTLPSGEVVPDGTDFRNGAHFRYKADLFVPCGGRPEAVNISNVADLFDEDGKCHYKYIIEGANLFLTQQARLYLEKRGVVVFKDASANKGGVTSSSLEVLAGLGLNDQVCCVVSAYRVLLIGCLGIPQPHGLQGRKAVIVLSRIRQGDPSQDRRKCRSRICLYLEGVFPSWLHKSAHHHLR